MRILVSGASGFIGRTFAHQATAAGHEVTSLGRTKPPGVLHSVVADFGTGEGLAAITWHNYDAFVHLAAAGVKHSQRVWPECLRTNVLGTQRLLDEIERADTGMSVWLAQTFYELEAAGDLLNDPYIATKAAAHELALAWSRRYRGAVVFGQLFQVYGPGDNPNNVLTYAARRLKCGEPAEFGSGRGLRDWIFVTDVADGILASLGQARAGVAHRCDLGSGKLFSVREVLEQLADLAGVNRELLRFDSHHDRSDVLIQRKAVEPPAGWHPRVALTDGLRAVLSAT